MDIYRYMLDLSNNPDSQTHRNIKTIVGNLGCAYYPEDNIVMNSNGFYFDSLYSYLNRTNLSSENISDFTSLFETISKDHRLDMGFSKDLMHPKKLLKTKDTFLKFCDSEVWSMCYFLSLLQKHKNNKKSFFPLLLYDYRIDELSDFSDSEIEEMYTTDFNGHSGLLIIENGKMVMYDSDYDKDTTKWFRKISILAEYLDLKPILVKGCGIQTITDDTFCLFHCLRILLMVAGKDDVSVEDIKTFSLTNGKKKKMTYDMMVQWIRRLRSANHVAITCGSRVSDSSDEFDNFFSCDSLTGILAHIF